MRIFLIAISLLLGACSTLPPAFEDGNIKHISYARVSEDAQRYKNTRVRWGGVIIDLKNEENFSLMQVQFYPLDFYGRPEIDETSAGHFFIKSAEKLDPKDYAANREIAVVGVIEGKTGPSESHGTTGLPLIKATAIHLWPIAYRNNYYRHCPSCYFRQLFW